MRLQRILATAFAVPVLSLGIGSSAALAQVSEPAQATTIAQPANARTDYSRGYRDGYRDGHADARKDCKKKPRYGFRRGQPSNYDRGYMAGYDKAYREYCRR